MTDTANLPTTTDGGLPGNGHFFQVGNYAPVADELTEFDLTVEGAIPAELDGWYLRNGPNPRKATGHWFTGDGMIHGVRDRGRPRQVVPQPVGAHRQLRGAVPALQRRRHAQPARRRGQHPRRQPRGQDARAGRVVAAVRDHQRPRDRRRLRLRRQARRLDDRPPQDLPDDRRDALLRLRQHLRAARHLPPRRRQRRADDQPAARRQGADDDARLRAHREHVIFMDLPIVFNLDVAASGKRRHALPLGRRLRRAARRAAPRRSRSARCAGSRSTRATCSTSPMRTTPPTAKSIVLQAVRYPELWRDNGGFDADGVLWTWTIDLAAGTRHRAASSTTAPSSSPASTTGWPACPRGTRCRSAATGWCATT